MMTIGITHDGTVEILGSEDELQGLMETIEAAIDDGEARGDMLADDGVVPVLVRRLPDDA